MCKNGGKKGHHQESFKRVSNRLRTLEKERKTIFYIFVAMRGGRKETEVGRAN